MEFLSFNQVSTRPRDSRRSSPKIGIVGLGLDRRFDRAAPRAQHLADVARHRRRQQGRPRDGDAAARDRRRGRRPHRPGRGRHSSSWRRRCGRTSRLLDRARRDTCAAGGGHRYRQHEARHRRRGAHVFRRDSRSSAATRSAARRQRARSTRARICSRAARGCSRRRARRRRRARQADWRSSRALGAMPRVLGAAAHDRPARLPEPPAAAHGERADAGGRGQRSGDDGSGACRAWLADTTRLASSPADIWQDIAATNADENRRRRSTPSSPCWQRAARDDSGRWRRSPRLTCSSGPLVGAEKLTVRKANMRVKVSSLKSEV